MEGQVNIPLWMSDQIRVCPHARIFMSRHTAVFMHTFLTSGISITGQWDDGNSSSCMAEPPLCLSQYTDCSFPSDLLLFFLLYNESLTCCPRCPHYHWDRPDSCVHRNAGRNNIKQLVSEEESRQNLVHQRKHLIIWHLFKIKTFFHEHKQWCITSLEQKSSAPLMTKDLIAASDSLILYSCSIQQEWPEY